MMYIPGGIILCAIAACLLVLFIGACVEAKMMGYNPITNFVTWLRYFLR